jgi:hypothetical protein
VSLDKLKLWLKNRFGCQDLLIKEYHEEELYWVRYEDGKEIKIPRDELFISIQCYFWVEDTSSKKFLAKLSEDISNTKGTFKIIKSSFGVVGVVTKIEATVSYKLKKNEEINKYERMWDK